MKSIEPIRIVYAGSPGPGHGQWRPIPDTLEARAEALADGCQAITTMSFECEPERGKPEPLRFGDLWMDFDCKEAPDLAVIAARFFIQGLAEVFGINLNMLRIFMSGRKGLHLCIPAELFGGENGHPHLPRLHRNMTDKLLGARMICNSLGMLALGQTEIPASLEQGHIHDLVDSQLYSMGKGHLLRAANIRRPDGRYKVEVSVTEFFDLPVHELLDMTKAPRKIIVPICQPSLTSLSEVYDEALLLWQATVLPADSIASLEGCEFIQHCRENAAILLEPKWFMMLRILARLGKRGFALAHEYSKLHPEYSERKTQENLQRILRDNYSATCDAVQDVFKCAKRCPVRSPLELKGRHNSQKCVAAQSFQIREDGVYYSPSQGLEDDTMFICTPLRILGRTRQHDGSGWARLVEITAPDQTKRKVHLPMKDFAGRGDVLRALLLDQGLEMPYSSKVSALLMDYLRMGAPDEVFFTCVEQLGWHGDTYVLPDEQVGAVSDTTLYFENRSENLFTVSGSLEEWQEHVGRYAEGNPLLVFLQCFALAGALLRPLNIEGFGVHICGGSSSGKTTAAIVAGSVCGGGGNTGFVRQWRSTDNALESIAASHNDSLLVMDEMGQADSDVVNNATYMLANGQGKGRLRADASMRKPYQWKVNLLSTGEMSSSEKIEESGRHRAMAGQDARTINLPISSSEGFPVFETLHGFDTAAALSDHLKQAAQRSYGSPLRAFLRCLCGAMVADKGKNIESIERTMGAFVKDQCPPDASGQVKRVAQKFGLIAAVGAFAAGNGVFLFTEEDAIDAACLCFQHWLKQRAGMGDLELAKALERIKDFFNMNSENQFSDVDALSHANPQLKGYRWKCNGEQHYLLLGPVFSQLIRGCNKAQVLEELKRMGWVVLNANGNLLETKSVNGMNKRGIVFRPCAWTGPCEPTDKAKAALRQYAHGDDDLVF